MNDFFMKTAITIINSLLARMVDARTLEVIKRLVAEAAAFSDMTGPERREFVLKQIMDNFGYITSRVPGWLVNLAIEILVAKSKVAR